MTGFLTELSLFLTVFQFNTTQGKKNLGCVTKLTKKLVKSATILFVLKWIKKKKVGNKILLKLPVISLFPPTLPQSFHAPPLRPPLGKDYSYVVCVCIHTRMCFGFIRQHARSQFPDQELNPRPLQWKPDTLTTRPLPCVVKKVFETHIHKSPLFWWPVNP